MGSDRDRPDSRRRDRREEEDEAILDAEHFKAKIQPPKGKLSYAEILKLHETDDNDDDFFHITCHVDESLRERIELGEFVDLDKLLPKDKCGGTQVYNEAQRMQIFEQNGTTFWAPEQSMNVNSVRKWEQAFRIYATIYTNANPHCAGEIWQYIHVINVAASSYQWENVAYYDYTFRRLMERKPWRSWAKTYTQGWNLALRDSYATGGSSKPAPTMNNEKRMNQTHDWRDDCCWGFNRTRCKRGNGSCKYDHHCTYCGGWGHGSSVCRKKARKDGRGYESNFRDQPTAPSGSSTNSLKSSTSTTTSTSSRSKRK